MHLVTIGILKKQSLYQIIWYLTTFETYLSYFLSNSKAVIKVIVAEYIEY